MTGLELNKHLAERPGGGQRLPPAAGTPDGAPRLLKGLRLVPAEKVDF